MCSLAEHSDRSAREREAQRQEPIYAELAAEHGIPYEPPKALIVQQFSAMKPGDYQPQGHNS